MLAACAVLLSSPELAAKVRKRRPVERTAPRPTAPPGFVEMYVAGVMPSPDGHTLFLNDAAKTYFIPMGIGESEALSIHLRLERRRFERPLTHDLMDSALRELGGRVVKVHVDDLRSGVFTGTVFIQTRDRLISIDARPSDAVALALGNRAPIFVSQGVIDRASISSVEIKESLPREGEALPESMPQPGEPQKKPISL